MLGLSRRTQARIFNTYGPRMQPNDGRVVSNFIVQALCGEPITVSGDGGQTRSFRYVDDLVEGMLRFMDLEEPCPAPINIGNPGKFTIPALAEQVIKLTGSRSKLAFSTAAMRDGAWKTPGAPPTASSSSGAACRPGRGSPGARSTCAGTASRCTAAR
ncbi:MAG: NAD-dependent epimerase/dehydratase family protein [Variovorax sp.]|nr:MAG: NAD-dependent epimerase/dehydratase family protein [Variovorax sp.]